MELIDFQTEIIEDVKNERLSGKGSDEAFAERFTHLLSEAEVISDFTPAYYDDGTARIDGYNFNEVDGFLDLFIVDFESSVDRKNLITTDVRKTLKRLINFLAKQENIKAEIDFSDAVFGLLCQMEEKKQEITKYRLILLTNGEVSDRATAINLLPFDNRPVECQIWDTKRVFDTCCSITGREAIVINFQDYMPNGIPCVEAVSSRVGVYKSYLCVISGTALANIYDKFGSSLLEGNVRSFLSTKVAVNKKIRETILQRPEKFFAFNNGISVTVKKLYFNDTSIGRVISCADDFQIINGGQTTASLSNARFKDKACLDDIFVQMKVTEIDTERVSSADAEELMRNISRSSNSQNKVTDADFFSSHQFHIEMERYSEVTLAPPVSASSLSTIWFYERARGQYLQKQMRMTKSEREKFLRKTPKLQVITKTDLAKVQNTWLRKPQLVSRGAQTNFCKFAEAIEEQWEKDSTFFNQKYFKETVSLIILYRAIENLVTRQTWYASGYRANIVTYSIALFHELLNKQFPNEIFDLGVIWSRQAVPQVVSEIFTHITKAVNDAINAEDRDTINVTQWCKRDKCWERIKNIKIILEESKFLPLFISRDDHQRSNKTEKRKQKEVIEADAQITVVQKGASFWVQVNDFATAKKMLTPSRESALTSAMRIPKTVPQPFQCKELLRLLQDVESEGFKTN
jgi:hypothetical protein